MVNPTPAIWLDGALLKCAAATDPVTGAPVFDADDATLIDTLAIRWGRADVWTQPEPAVVTFALWEAQSTWLGKIIAQTALRRAVLVSFARGAGGDRTIFQGFTTNVDVVAESRRTPRGMTPGWRVQIQASDRAGFIGQESWGPQTLPEESMQSRAVRIRNQAASTGIRQFYFEDRFRAGIVQPRDVTDETVLDTMAGMYQSFADQWCYNPARNTINRIPGGSNWAPYYLRLGVSDTDTAVRLYPPVWGDPTGKEDPIDEAGYPTAYIGACDVAGPIALSASMIQDITHITCHWFDKPNGKDWSTTLVVRDQTPRARLEFDSWYNDGVYVDPILADVMNTVTKDGARPTHPEIVWDCARAGDVPDWLTFESLSLPCQTVRMVTLAGSPFTAGLGLPPVWHPCGGEVAYVRGRWRFTLNLAPTTMPLPADFAPVTFANLPASIALSDESVWHLDRSVTSYDLGFVPNADALLYAFN